MKLVTVAEIRAIEQEADSNGLTYAQMMENAARGLAQIIEEVAYSESNSGEIIALVGPGNNGGDALIALAHLAAQGWKARAYLVNRKTDGDPLISRLQTAGGEILLAAQDKDFASLASLLGSADVLVDGLLGIGAKLPLRPEMAAVMSAANTAIAALPWPPTVVAVDCPSGVDCDSGEAAPEVIPASFTVCMVAVKQGLLRLPAFELAGELRLVEIGVTDELSDSWAGISRSVADAKAVAELLPNRPLDSHKGTFGTVLIATGSLNYTGAALLAGKAAYRAGTGLVQMAVPGALHTALAGQLPEATWALLPHEMGAIAAAAAEVLFKNLDRATALLIGPGLGTEETTGKFVENLLTGKAAPKKSPARIGFVHSSGEKAEEKTAILPPLVMDADGLRLLAKLENWPKLLPPGSILTPHPGEMAALTGLEKDTIQKDRLTLALKYAAEWGQVVVLKGAFTVVAAPDGRATLIPVATPALARAGTGDVLAGLIVGLRAQGLEAYDAALCGAWIHAQAGLAAVENVGAEASVLASDVLDAVADILGNL